MIIVVQCERKQEWRGGLIWHRSKEISRWETCCWHFMKMKKYTHTFSNLKAYHYNATLLHYKINNETAFTQLLSIFFVQIILKVFCLLVSVNVHLNTNDLQEVNRIISRWQFLLLILKHDPIDLANLLIIVFTFVVVWEKETCRSECKLEALWGVCICKMHLQLITTKETRTLNQIK